MNEKTDTTNSTMSCIVCGRKFKVTNNLEDFDKICKSGVILISKQSKMFLPIPNEQGGAVSKIDGMYCSPLCLMKHTFKSIKKYNTSDNSLKIFAEISVLADKFKTDIMCDEWAKQHTNIKAKKSDDKTEKTKDKTKKANNKSKK